jgi:hypothetical protein
MIADLLFDSVQEIEDYEKDSPFQYEAVAAEIRKVKAEMSILRLILDSENTVAQEDFDWVRTESIRRAETKPPYMFSEVFEQCVEERGQQKRNLMEKQS